MKKKLLGLLAIGLLHLPISCFWEGPNGGVIFQRAQYTALISDVGSYINETFVSWGGFSSRSWEEVVIAIKPEGIEFLSGLPKNKINISLSDFAWARDPAPPEFPMIDCFSMIADASFIFQNDTIAAGDTVNHLFNAITFSNVIGIDEYIRDHNQGFRVFGYDGDLLLNLMDSPGDTLESSFTVSIQFDDETTLSTQTPVVKVH